MKTLDKIKSLVPNQIKKPLKYLYIDYQLTQNYFDKDKLQQYKSEIQESDLIEQIKSKLEKFKQSFSGKNYRGFRYGLGNIPFENGIYLYAILRELKPEIAVETGVCNGVSTAFFLQALNKNQKGKLYSIDFPELKGLNYESGTFKGKRGDVIPADQKPGWAIPEDLKERWQLIIGKSQEKLPPLLAELGQIDFFIHDSEHSYECMYFEYTQAYQHLKNGGILMSDDLTWNNSFQDFSQQKNKRIIYVGSNIGFWVK